MLKEELKGKSIQEICDYSVSKMVEQKEQCLSSLGTCAYFNSLGQHCAIGHILDPSCPAMQGAGEDGIVDLINTNKVTAEDGFFKTFKEVLEALQNFHDADTTPHRDFFKDELTDLGIDTDKPQYWVWLALGEECSGWHWVKNNE